MRADPPVVPAVPAGLCCADALQMVGMDLNEDHEKKLVEGIFSSAVDLLSGES